VSNEAFSKWLLSNGSIGPWALDHKIAHGGMGIVFLGKKKNIHGSEDRAAIKIMTPETFRDANAKRLFRHEFDVLSRISTPYIPSVIDNGIETYTSGKQTLDLLWFAMEEVKGGSLDDELKKHGKLNDEEWLRLAHDLFCAIAEAHENGIIHKDIKPANIGRFARRSVLLDFGGASFVDIDDPGDVGILTYPYAAPEQHDFKTRPADLPYGVDLFAAGATLVEAATGHHPWALPNANTMKAFVQARPQLKGKMNDDELMMAYLLDQKRNVAPNFTGMSDQQIALVRPLLAPDPKERGTAREFLESLSSTAPQTSRASKSSKAQGDSAHNDRELKKLMTAWILSIVVGFFGVDRFYLGKVGTGVLKLLTIGGYGVWAFIDAYQLGGGKVTDKWGRQLTSTEDETTTISKWRVPASVAAGVLCILLIVWSQFNRIVNG
jgi:serine/threonine protein kinase